MRVIAGFFVVFAAAAAPLGLSLQAQSQSTASDTQTVWAGVYSETQAARGQSAYTSHCASCHLDDLSGYQNILRGDRFLNEYREANLYRLFDKIKTTMPRGSAGSLSDETYVDIVSYVLKANEFPAGSGDLALQDLSKILVVRQGGPEPVPNFSLVQVVGCLARNDSDSTWTVTNATEPVRATQPQATADELAASGRQPLGAGTVQLMLSPAHVPDPHKDHKVEARGFLIRRAGGNRINVTSLQTVAAGCSP